MGSRARTAAAACLVAGGVWAGCAGTPTAYADPADVAGATDAGVDDGVDDKADASERDAGGESRSEAEPAPPADEASDDEASVGENVDGDTKVAAAEDPSRPCCKDGSKDCGHGWPWPWPDDDPDPPGAPNPSGAGGGSDRPVGVPRPAGPPRIGTGPAGTRPPTDVPFDPDVIDTIPGAGLPAAGTAAPISVPILAVPVPVPVPVPAGTGGAATPAGTGGGMPAGPRGAVAEPPPARQPPPPARQPPPAPEVAGSPRDSA
ncbi:hypothetical protein, partial [Mycolicibacterium psychrotolerans]|uniref:hypothetical protein n=1 Tax=Mycolicibacterium psychrotolerans TaxID=216929 RepID=UPI003908941F